MRQNLNEECKCAGKCKCKAQEDNQIHERHERTDSTTQELRV